MSDTARREPKQLLLTHRDVAAMIGVPHRKLLRMARTGHGDFPAPVRVAERTYFFSREAVEKWCQGRRPG